MMKLVDFNMVVKYESEDGQGGRSEELETLTSALAKVMSKEWDQKDTDVLDNKAREHFTRFVDVLTYF